MPQLHLVLHAEHELYRKRSPADYRKETRGDLIHQ
jgi:hypothetical protein